MEQHPVPQNIAGFQFKLIGDMTVKQFLFLAGGVLSAYIILQFNWPSLIKWFLAIVVAGGGFAFAFVPVEERPLDRWLVAFFQRIYLPTQFLWKKRANTLDILTAEITSAPAPSPEIITKEAADVKLEEYLSTLPTPTVGFLDEEETAKLAQVSAFFSPSIIAETPTGLPENPEPPVAPPPPSTNAPTETPVPAETPPSGQASLPPPVQEIDQKTKNLTARISSLQEELSRQTITHERFLEIQAQLTGLMTEKERLSKELLELKKQLAEKPEMAVKPTMAAQAPEEIRVKVVSPTVAPKIGMPRIPSVPNVISGIVKTQKGAILPGILVEIRNQEGTPVRALKTGKLGQFAISTPLSNGTYILYLEDPQQTFHFDIIELTLNGGVVSPLEIFAKTERDKMREQLRQKLFNQDNF